MTVKWPPNVWHGVIDPITGEKIPPIKMSYLTREERIEQQKLDSGSSDDDVLVRRGTKITHYHNEECRLIKDSDSTR